jgi:DNA-binding transcriptional ArsR family regulator
LIAFDALSQETRLEVFRLLVKKGPAGAPAGALSEALGVPHNSLSFHLNHMSHAGLVRSQREGRSIIYSANFEFMSGLLRFMLEDCCGGSVGALADECAGGSCGPVVPRAGNRKAPRLASSTKRK